MGLLHGQCYPSISAWNSALQLCPRSFRVKVNLHWFVSLSWCLKFKSLSSPCAWPAPHLYSCLESYGAACIFTPDSILPAFLLLSLEPFHISPFWFLHLFSDTLLILEKSIQIIWSFFLSSNLNRSLSFWSSILSHLIFMSLISSCFSLCHLSLILCLPKNQFHLICFCTPSV